MKYSVKFYENPKFEQHIKEMVNDMGFVAEKIGKTFDVSEVKDGRIIVDTDIKDIMIFIYFYSLYNIYPKDKRSLFLEFLPKPEKNDIIPIE